MDRTGMSAAERAEGPAPSSMRRWALLAAKALFTGAVIAAVGYATVSQWGAVKQTLLELTWTSVAGSLVLALLGLGAQTLAFRAVLADLGHRVEVRVAGKIYLIGLLGKYLPGSVWTFVMQMELGRRAGIPRPRALLAPLVCLAISTSAAGVLAAPVLVGLGNAAVTVSVVVVALVALTCTHPRVLTVLIGRILAVTRRPPLPAPISWRAVASCFGWSLLAWVCFGIHLWLLTDEAGLGGASGLVICVGAFALALTAGIAAFLSPSGLGVRESAIAAVLLAYVPFGVGLGMALVSRLIFTVADVIAATAAALSGSRVLAQPAQPLRAGQVSDPVEW